jgi:hypothetical protein
MSVPISEEIDDGKNGILCWFYVYKKNETRGSSICGIVIIKQLTDTPDNVSESDLSNVTSDKVFFFTETKRNVTYLSGRDESIEYSNDTLIREFIDTKPTYTDIQKFNTDNKDKKFIYGEYSYLPIFLNDLIIKNFKMFENSTDDKSIR